MKITLEDIRAKFDALVAQQQSAEQVAAFAMAAIQASDAKRLDLEKEFADQIWKAILYLSGVDLQISPGRYLHSTDDFLKARQSIVGSSLSP